MQLPGKLYIDIETYSGADLRKVGAYVYSEHPEFEILMAAWALDDAPVQVAIGWEAINAIPYLWDDRVPKVAHNAQFERVCFSAAWARSCGNPTHGTYLNPEDWIDTQALAAEWGYPQGLDALAKALGVEEKDTAGTRLISLFCKPVNRGARKGKRNLPEDYPEDWAAFVEYCRQDVVTLRAVEQKLGSWPTPAEAEAYYTDQRINDRGMPVDVDMAAIAVQVAEDNRMLQEIEFTNLTGVQNPGSGPQVMAWLAAQRVPLPNLQKETIETALQGSLPTKVRQALELRQELALVAAKKYTAAIARTSPDGRLRGGFKFFGAHTGRWAGSGVQMQNLPSATLTCSCQQCTDDPKHPGAFNHVEGVIAAAVLDLKLGLGADAHTLKALVRAMFVGPFTVVDYAAIEARVVAWLAGEEWALQAFRDGRDIYVETAERMGGLTRKEGKVAVLALGYNGGVNSLRVMGAEGDDDKLQYLVNQWRGANPAIVGLWHAMDHAFKFGGPVGDRLYVEKDGTDRLLRLPSGRAIVYHDVRLGWVEKWGKRVQQASFADPKPGAPRTSTYGGRLVENVTQAVARDVLAEALVRLDGAGWPVVGHVHDEILVLGKNQPAITRQMTVTPKWAAGLPIDGAGFVCARYRKD